MAVCMQEETIAIEAQIDAVEKRLQFFRSNLAAQAPIGDASECCCKEADTKIPKESLVSLKTAFFLL